MKIYKAMESERGLTWFSPSQSPNRDVRAMIHEAVAGRQPILVATIEEAVEYLGLKPTPKWAEAFNRQPDVRIREDLAQLGYCAGWRRQLGSDSYNLVWVVL